MDWQPFQDWLSLTNLFAVAAVLFGLMGIAAVVGVALHGRGSGPIQDSGEEGYIVTAVLGLLALLMGFTFSLAVDRFDARRLLVLEEANAIGTAYLRVQLLPEPHRSRMSGLLAAYLDNRITLGKATPDAVTPLLTRNDAMVSDLWAATSAALDDIRTLEFSGTFVDSMSTLVELDAARKAARMARVPAEVFVVLFVYLITTAGVLGYVLSGWRGRLAAGFLLSLLTLSMMLVIDIDRPTLGGILESQRPMEDLRRTLNAQPPSTFDKWRMPFPSAAAQLDRQAQAPARHARGASFR